MFFIKTVAGLFDSDKRKIKIHGTCKIRGLYTTGTKSYHPTPKPTIYSGYCKVLEEICLFKPPNLNNFLNENDRVNSMLPKWR